MLAIKLGHLRVLCVLLQLGIAGIGGLAIIMRSLAGGINPLGKTITDAFEKYSDQGYAQAAE